MYRIRGILNNIKIKNKLLIIYLVCVLFPILIINFVFYKDIEMRIKNEQVINLQGNLEKIQQEVEEAILQVAGFTNTFYLDESLYEVIDQWYTSELEFLDRYQTEVKKKIFGDIPYYPQIGNIMIYTDNPTILSSGGIQIIDKKAQKNLMPQYDEDKGDIMLGNGAWIETGTKEIMQDNYSYRGLSIYRKLDRYKNLANYHKVLRIDISYERMQDILANSHVQGDLYLINNDEKTILKTMQPEDNDRESGAKNQFIIKQASNIGGWKIIGVFRESQIYEAIRPAQYKTYIMAGISLLLATLCIWLVSYSFYKRIGDILRHISRVENEEFELMEEGKESKDEIGSLIRSLNQMSLKIKELIQNKYKMEIKNTKIALESRQAELNALQSQVNPHFMFNALEALRFRSLMKNERETAQMIKYMSKMFRKLIVWHTDWITVKEEIEFIMEFLEIQKYRFDDELKFDISIEDTIYIYKIPKMILQPLVENACIHGVEHITSTRHIKIEGHAKGKLIYLSVEDNGIGMEEEKIQEILTYVGDNHYNGMSVGLRNVLRRLTLYYGEKSQVIIESERNKYTRITLIMPIVDNEQG